MKINKFASFMLSALVAGATASDECDTNGYEVWIQRDPADINMEVALLETGDDCTYDLTVYFTPPTDLPFMNDVSAANFFTSDPANFHATCTAEGRLENEENPVRTPDKAPDHHVGLNTHFAEYVYTMELDAEMKELTGYDHVSVGAAPCGTLIQPFPHYNVHFYTATIAERMEMRCSTNGGFFCLPDEQQCSESGKKMNMDGTVERCENGYGAAANVPFEFAWADDFSPIGRNAASAGQGLHGIDPMSTQPPENGGYLDASMPNNLILNYDREVIANHVAVWSGFSHRQATSTTYEKEMPYYNCPDEVKHGSRPTLSKVYVEDFDGTDYTAVSMSGKAGTCTWKEQPPASCGTGGFLRIVETFDFIALISPTGNPFDGSRSAGDYDVWEDYIYLQNDPNPVNYNLANPAYPGAVGERLGKHFGKCTFLNTDGAVHCEGSMYIDHPDIGKGSISIQGGAPIQINDFGTYLGGEIQFTVTGGTGTFLGIYGEVSPAIQPFMTNPDGHADTPFPSFAYPVPGLDMFLGITYTIGLNCPPAPQAAKSPKAMPKMPKAMPNIPKAKALKAPKGTKSGKKRRNQ